MHVYLYESHQAFVNSPYDIEYKQMNIVKLTESIVISFVGDSFVLYSYSEAYRTVQKNPEGTKTSKGYRTGLAPDKDKVKNV